jgi:anti-sigma B factor antagonist
LEKAMTLMIPHSGLLSVADGPAQTIMRLGGECDVATAGRLRAALGRTATQPAHLVIADLSGLTFLDSAGIHALIDAHQALAAAGKQLVLACPPPIVARMLTLTGADQLIRVVATMDEATTPGGSSHRS